MKVDRAISTRGSNWGDRFSPLLIGAMVESSAPEAQVGVILVISHFWVFNTLFQHYITSKGCNDSCRHQRVVRGYFFVNFSNLLNKEKSFSPLLIGAMVETN